MINEFITSHYDRIVKMARNVCKCPPDPAGELAHYTMEQFMTKPNAEALIGRREAMKFMSGIMWLSWHSSTSPYHKLYRQSGRVVELYDKTAEKRLDVEYDFETDLTIEAIQGIMEDMESDGVEQWFRVTLFKMWLNESNYSELGRITGIARTTIAQAVKECKEYIKQRIQQNGINT